MPPPRTIRRSQNDSKTHEPFTWVFRLLGHHPGPDFTSAAVAALADISSHEAEDALESLQDENLVRQSAPGRYELHDPLRLLAVELAEAEPEQDPDAPLARLATWGVTTGYAAAVAINTPQLESVTREERTAAPRRFEQRHRHDNPLSKQATAVVRRAVRDWWLGP